MYDWYVGTDPNYNKYYPNDFLPYKIMDWGINHDYKLFDFGGAGTPDISYGVRDFKVKFGGELVNLCRFKRINNKVLWYFSNFGFRLFRKLKKIR